MHVSTSLIPTPLRRAASREVTVLIINDTPDQLELDSQSAQLKQGEWGDDTPGQAVIKPGGSAMMNCRSAGIGRGAEGSVMYRFAGQPPHDRVKFSWKNRYFGPNVYDGETSREGYRVAVQGGDGADAIVAFILRN
ncbi:hypothetical protein OQA88_1073 [Cercophora sp. LCS_1]